ncbi:MAG: GTPase HflX [Vicinamibacterales bacterium]
MSQTATPSHGERAVLVGLSTPTVRRHDAERSLEELAGLADAAGASVVARVIQDRPGPDKGTYIGGGKAASVGVMAGELDAGVVIVDGDLSPGQQRRLEAAAGCRVIDRTQLILDIFARRARTREGQWQVELAQLKYMLPRLVGSSEALSRLGGGIGTRGPGETKLETDRRRVRTRIQAIEHEIERVRDRRAQLRDRRHKARVPTVALVGYTNAGKTTLFNRLTNATAVASDALFVTLDPLVRQARLPDNRVLLVSDTVGFIDRLPHGLVAAFRATLEEVAAADLVLHVIDAANEDRDRQVAAVLRVLDEVEAGDVPRLDVFNKVDCLSLEDRRHLAAGHPGAWLVSAATGEGVDACLDAVTVRLGLDTERVVIRYAEGDAVGAVETARLYQTGRVVRHETANGEVIVEADVPKRLRGRQPDDDGEVKEIGSNGR